MAGGAWKVAYADFVTALMALFMVLWIVSQDDEIVIKTVEYFKDPFGVGFQDSQNGAKNDNSDSSGESFTNEEKEESSTTMVDLALLHKLANEYYEKLNIDNLDPSTEKPIKVDVLPDGLRITVFNKSNHRLFKKNTAEFTEWGRYIIQNIAWVVDRNDMLINIDAHTPKDFLPTKAGYGMWELTTDRSNNTRKLLEDFALAPSRVRRVSGFADRQPLPEIKPDLSVNERLEISLVIQ